MDLSTLLQNAINKNASDLHLSSSLPPLVRIDGQLQHLDSTPLDENTVKSLLQSVMDEPHLKEFETTFESDFAFEIKQLARFRVNAFKHNRGTGGAIRVIPLNIPTFDSLKLPQIIKTISSFPRGLVLVTGPTGSGKSSTLASMINYINTNRYEHILTIEDPIEYIHTSNQCLINQREVHRDTASFNSALRSALREDPDVILVGELRDIETIRLALTAAETGHLVLGTLHTSSASKSINRIIDVFPGDQQNMVRSMLSESLQAVVSQTLLKKMSGGRVAALEIMICTPAIRNLIREDKVAQMYSSIQTGIQQGMQTLDQHLKQLAVDKIISKQTAYEVAVQKEQFI